MADNKDVDGSKPAPPITPGTDQAEPQTQSEQYSKYQKTVNSVYFKVALTGVMMLLLFLTAFFIAVVSELREQKTEQLDLGVPDAEIILPTSEPTIILTE